MSKNLLYSDVHLRPDRLRDIQHVFTTIGDAAIKHGVVASGGYVINGGDLFNERGLIRTSCFDALYASRLNWFERDIKHIDNIGNHDQEDRDGEVHPLRVFSRFRYWQVADKPLYIKRLDAFVIPYTHQMQETLAALPADFSGTLIIHAGIRDAWRNDKSQDKDGLDPNIFARFRRVFSGHYHNRHSFANIQYIGSPLQQSFAEMGQDKGYLIWDNETDEVEFYEIAGTPKHYEVVMEWDDKGRSHVAAGTEHAIGANDIVRFKLIGRGEHVHSVTKEKLFAISQSKNIKVERIIKDETTSRLNLGDGDSVKDAGILEKYIDFVAPTLDRDRLLKLGLELMS